MTDKPAALPVTDPHKVPVVFVNQVVGSGHLNGNVNLTFAVAQFTPKNGEIDPDLVVMTRLRMDMSCAEQLYTVLGTILQDQSGAKPN